MKNLMFDYQTLGKNLSVPARVVKNLEKEARNEFPLDNMLMEIHVLRAVKSYARVNNQVVSVEN